MSQQNGNSNKYTTGEIAKLCGVTVRTVQYYDTRGILIPSELSEGLKTAGDVLDKIEESPLGKFMPKGETDKKPLPDGEDDGGVVLPDVE